MAKKTETKSRANTDTKAKAKAKSSKGTKKSKPKVKAEVNAKAKPQVKAQAKTKSNAKAEAREENKEKSKVQKSKQTSKTEPAKSKATVEAKRTPSNKQQKNTRSKQTDSRSKDQNRTKQNIDHKNSPVKKSDVKSQSSNNRDQKNQNKRAVQDNNTPKKAQKDLQGNNSNKNDLTKDKSNSNSNKASNNRSTEKKVNSNNSQRPQNKQNSKNSDSSSDQNKQSGKSNNSNGSKSAAQNKTQDPKKNVQQAPKQHGPKIKEYQGLKIDRSNLLSSLQRIDSYYKEKLSNLDAFLTRELFVDSQVRILLCVSGGIDSIVMLDMMANLALDRSYELSVAHYDHQLRDSSHKDAAFVRRIAKKYNIEVTVEKGDVESYAKQNKLSIEEAARKKRYQFFERVARAKKVNFVATAHNANDSTETFFINLFRGSGLTGLGGIPQKRGFYKNINIIRPLLIFTRKEIEEYAKKRKLRWREDETNQDNSFVRNKIRNYLLPILEQEYVKDLYNVVNRSARMINSADRFIYTRIKPSLDDITIKNGKGYLILDLRRLNLFEDFIKRELIAMSLNKFMNLYDVSYNKLMGLSKLIHAQSGKEFIINGDIKAHKDRDELVVYRQDIFKEFKAKISINKDFKMPGGSISIQKVKNSKDIRLTDDPNIEFIPGDLLNGQLEIRPVIDGDRFKPIGMIGTQKVRDFLVNNKVDFINSKRALVLTCNDDIVWVIGHRISNDFKLTDQRNNIIKLEFKEYNS